MAHRTRRVARVKRHARVRERVRGTAARPRLAVFRSLTHIYAQLIDDENGRTLAAASSLDVGPAAASPSPGARAGAPAELSAPAAAKIERAKAVGKALGERAGTKGIALVVFDRGGYRYHGRVRALAEAAREAGLRF